ncbi:nucleoporin complex subunit 54-domain-containing protein [Desarmillaria tabescens]|uniref:Nucleoporin complex subunit 54-domain-containing protein n=1 Tax=Armillaria tabescens TaxID=1929756 RepID=A0AA39NP48_ARMTA|nr:nucleoporin complex subunit 54-domain-containing protein [Desarmillaria tabescens]KAK0469240.1 nucleoporin complex subunit 54-domain-containing protein [Desarmillaria tabescens]
MSLFGATNTTTPAGGNLFGSNAQQQPAATGGGLFGGNSTQTQTATPSLFGSTNTGSSAFGQNTASNTNTGSSIFGSTATQPQTNQNSAFALKPSVFGQTGTGTTVSQPAQSTSSFFSTPPAGQQNQQNQQAKPNLFNTTNPSFGGTSTSTGTNPLFGSSTTSPNTNTTTTNANPLFGSTSTNTTTQNPLFGSTTNTNTVNPMFGSSSTTSAPTTNTNIFGTTSTSTNPMFGSSTNTTLGNSTLGTSALGGSTLGTNAFGARPQLQSTLGANSLLKSTAPASQQQLVDAQTQFAKLSQKIESIANAWNPSSPQCRFQHYFYNLVEPNQVNMYGRPPNATNDALWQKAVQENPDPSCLVPVIANGFDDLRQRVDGQSEQATAHKGNIKDLQKRLADLQTQHSTNTISRLARFSQTQIQLAQRIMALVQHLHLLIPTVRSSAIRPEEEELFAKIESIEEEVRGGKGKMKAKLDELWAVFGALKAREEGIRERRNAGDWKVDEEGLARIAQILSEQQNGLAYLTTILQKNLKDLGVIMGTGPTITAGDDSMEGENLWTSTSTLRASTLR